MSTIRLSAAEIADRLAAGEVSSAEVTQDHLDRIAAVDGDLNAFLALDADGALSTARDVDARRAAAEQLHPLAGVPIAVKDVVATAGIANTAGSRIWRVGSRRTTPSSYAAPRGRAADPRQDQHGLVRDGQLDEHSLRPHRTPGTVTASRRFRGRPCGRRGRVRAPLAIGTDTGGSIRQPAASPAPGRQATYGGVSRYGLIALASSLDQAGPVTRTVLDAALLHELIGGHDPLDSTSIDAPVPPVVEAARRADVSGLRIGVVRELGGEGYQAGVRARFDEAVALLTKAGAEIVEVCAEFDLRSRRIPDPAR